MEGESEPGRAEQRAFANHAVTVGNSALGAVFVALLGFVLLPLFMMLPLVAQRIVALSLAAGIAYYFYLNVRLGGSGEHSEHRSWYLRFRFGFLTNNFTGHYAALVKRAISWTDRVLGDSGDAPKGLFPQAFGLKQAAPLWTASSYDRSLLLALTYPLAAMTLVWAIWGEVGTLEAALGMKVVPGWQRGLAFLSLVVGLFAALRLAKTSGYAANAVWAVVVVGLILLSFYLGAGAGAVAGAVAVAVAGAVAGAGAVAVVFVVVSSSNWATSRWGMARVLPVFTCLMTLLVLWPMPLWLADLSPRPEGLTLLYFFGLLTLINAPFDWLAIGVTRGLLRRGQELGAHWPLTLALADFVLSLVLMAALAIAVLWATELFNHAAITGGGKEVIDVSAYLQALSDPGQRGDPKYYWLYAMLFSSQIPAVVNLVLAALCLLRGLPKVNGWIVSLLPEAGEIGSWTRLRVAAAASLQLAVAIGIGLAVWWGLATVLIAVLDPLFGNGLIDMLRALRIGPLL